MHYNCAISVFLILCSFRSSTALKLMTVVIFNKCNMRSSLNSNTFKQLRKGLNTNSFAEIVRPHEPESIKLQKTAATKQDTYEYIDSGNYKRLEKFGPYYVVRSCPSATWRANYKIPEWFAPNRLVYGGQSGKPGTWTGLNNLDPKSPWIVKFDDSLSFTLNTSDFGQVGVFPEQYENWKWITQMCEEFTTQNINLPRTVDIELDPPVSPFPSSPTSSGGFSSNKSYSMKVLNGFAYTGGSTLAALRVHGVQVVHVDSAKSTVEWACRNAFASNLADRPVRWIVDDITRFVEREGRRRSRYEGLIFDPPAFGRSGTAKGPRNGIWNINEDLPALAKRFKELLSENGKFILLTSHDMNWPAARLAELLDVHAPLGGVIKYGSLDLNPTKSSTSSGKSDSKKSRFDNWNSLPMGHFAQWSR